ncbi:MAG: methyltransferase domain-containing protein [Endomicrobiales bacterium]|nr:methyltransferase domain-containing protein [Endomicrobiales bacterium]
MDINTNGINTKKGDVNVFDRYSERYDRWFERNRLAFLSELKALKKVVPKAGDGLEVGVGTGKFAESLGIKAGIDPSKRMLAIARKRGIEIYEGYGESLPFKDESFDYLLLVVTICFVKDADKVINEANRVLKPKGKVIIGIIDANSFLGKYYRQRKDSPFYKNAKFYSPREVIKLIGKYGFRRIKTYQTLFKIPETLKAVDAVKTGFGRGSFVVISGAKTV